MAFCHKWHSKKKKEALTALTLVLLKYWGPGSAGSLENRDLRTDCWHKRV